MTVLVVAPDPARRRELAGTLEQQGLRVLEARSPLEGLWHAPDVEAVAIESLSPIELRDGPR